MPFVGYILLNPKDRLARWVIDLQEHLFDIKLRPANGNDDALLVCQVTGLPAVVTGQLERWRRKQKGFKDFPKFYKHS